jgi:hypothetical protein
MEAQSHVTVQEKDCCAANIDVATEKQKPGRQLLIYFIFIVNNSDHLGFKG